jgi:hypothetical protein
MGKAGPAANAAFAPWRIVEAAVNRERNRPMRIPLPFEEAVKAGLETLPPERVQRGKKARVASRSKRKKS